MGEWSQYSKSHVANMKHSDFYASEKSVVIDQNIDVKIEFTAANGNKHILKEQVSLLTGEVIDSAVMSYKSLKAYFDEEIKDAKDQGLLLSLHLKATMMKVSDPIIFGHAVEAYFKDVFNKYQSIFEELGIKAKNGLGDVLAKIEQLPKDQKTEILSAINACYENNPPLAMVNSDKGITNLHVPSDVIIDASMLRQFVPQAKCGDRMENYMT